MTTDEGKAGDELRSVRAHRAPSGILVVFLVLLCFIFIPRPISEPSTQTNMSLPITTHWQVRPRVLSAKGGRLTFTLLATPARRCGLQQVNVASGRVVGPSTDGNCNPSRRFTIKVSSTRSAKREFKLSFAGMASGIVVAVPVKGAKASPTTSTSTTSSTSTMTTVPQTTSTPPRNTPKFSHSTYHHRPDHDHHPHFDHRRSWHSHPNLKQLGGLRSHPALR